MEESTDMSLWPLHVHSWTQIRVPPPHVHTFGCAAEMRNYPGLVSVAATKHGPESTWGGKVLLFWLAGHCLTSRKATAGIKQKPQRNDAYWHSPMVCSPCLCNPGLPAQWAKCLHQELVKKMSD